MKRVGEILQEERARQGKTLKELSLITKIRVYFLQAIEEGAYDRLPNVVYIKGFIQGYAQALGLDEEKILPFYRREFTEKETTVSTKRSFVGSLGPWLTLTPGKIIGGIIALMLTVFLAILFFQYQQFSGAPVLIIDSPIQQLETIENEIRVMGKTSPNAQVTVNGENVSLSSDGTFDLIYKLEKGLNRIRVTSISRLGKSVVEERLVEQVIPEVSQPVPLESM